MGDGPPGAVDLLVLAGGRGERLGGQDKAALVLDGRPLLDRVLDAAPSLGGRVVVVGDTAVPPGVLRTLEDPPDGGPVAGIDAGLAVLGRAGRDGGPAPWVAVVAVDQPAAAQALSSLRAALTRVPDDVDAVSHVDGTGHRQWLLALYRRAALEGALAALPGARHTSVRRLVGDLAWWAVDAGGEHVGDVDTWADLEGWERRLRRGRMAGQLPEKEG
ncbi:molybdenum cofactor guanylyltransferase [Ornithinimicrobium avium]|uniref:molybdenum cofactor guanylyltransferase n=1 Tax=Ornithinimicrobium avium TaxID=2283195 RepID=UPI0013B3D845|nr:NTP transferase domain-containing protein [Ornithinimicrobium avium]